MRVFGIDPGSIRTGYGCIDATGPRHRLVTAGALVPPAGAPLPERLQAIYSGLCAVLSDVRPEYIAVESIFHAANARSALILGHARGAAILAAVQSHVPIIEYSPAEIKRAVTGYGRADKQQMQHMIKLLLGLDAVPTPHDAADALAIAVCHVHRLPSVALERDLRPDPAPAVRSWRQWKPRARDDGRA